MDEFKFKMTGPIFEEGIPLHIALSSMQDVQSIFDKSYLTLAGGKQLPRKVREDFFLRTFDIRHGSLESDLQIVLAGAQYAFPIIGAFTPSDIWDLTQRGWEFLRFVYEKVNQGQQPTYEAKDNGQIVVITGDGNTVFMRDAVTAGTAAVPHWRSLNHKLQSGQIEGYSMGSAVDPQIFLGSNSRTLFDNPSKVDQEQIAMTCDIYDFNKRDKVGKLTVIDGDIPHADYAFEVVGDQDRLNYISSMVRQEVHVTALREVVLNPLGEQVVKKLHIIGIDDAA